MAQCTTSDLLRALSSSRAVAFYRFLQTTQTRWAEALQSLEPTAVWQREQRTLTHHDSVIFHMSEGQFLEKAGINTSLVLGDSLPVHATQTEIAHLAEQPFLAMGISTILHPRNPYVPTVHCNLRYFQTRCENPTWWFAGVMDLTPTYGFDEDCAHWHRTCQSACLTADDPNYAHYKAACDQYYYLPHRREHRGIGGLWIEQHNQASFSSCQGLITSVGDHFLPAYLPIATRRMKTPYCQRSRDFLAFRRTRYAEFNLLYDRGTKFGLSMGSRAESILISMPPVAKWPYQWAPEPGTPEAKLTEHTLQPRDWLEPIAASSA